MTRVLPKAPAQSGALASFYHRSFRFQWMADLSTSWAFEMETIMLSWYILVETKSVLLLTLFASTQYIGTLFSPMFGVMGHRLGNKRVYCAMRACYTTLGAVMMLLILAGALTPLYVFIICSLMGLVRPSDLVLRYALIGETMPSAQLMAATSVSRTTQDSARVIGALAGAGIVAALGLGVAYVVVTCLYAASFLFSLHVDRARPDTPHAGTSAALDISVWRDLREGAAHVWRTPQLLAAMSIALLVNLTAFPLTTGLMPYVAKEIFHTDQTGLGYLAAGFAFGALLGSIFLSRFGQTLPPARMMIGFCAAWYAMLLIFAHVPQLAGGVCMLVLTGCAQSLSMVPMSAMLLRGAGPRFRGHVMGIRMLMIYSLPIGLVIAGPLITRYGYRATAIIYCAIGLAATAWIALRWRAHVWQIDAPGNRH
jgi:predicted MFS family arabinose efflux permease